MSTTAPVRPHSFWKQEASTLRHIAPSMTLQQLVARYNTTPVRMRQTLNQLGIEFAGKHKGALTQAQGQELAKLAPKHTPRQLSEHFGVHLDRIHAYLARHKIKAKRAAAHALWNSRRPELEKIAPSMTLKALQAHYQQQGHTHTIGAIRQALTLLGIEWQRTRVQSELYSRKTELASMASRFTCQEMAAQLDYSPKYLWKVLDKMGITPLQGKSGPAPKVRTPKPLTKAPKPSHLNAGTHAAIPSRASIASKTPAQIIWPEHVQIQRIPLATPPAHAPICASTAGGTYTPSKDWYRSPRAH